MSVLYCTVPDQVKYSTVVVDEYQSIPKKASYCRAMCGEFISKNNYIKATGKEGESFLMIQILVNTGSIYNRMVVNQCKAPSFESVCRNICLRWSSDQSILGPSLASINKPIR